MNRLVVSIFVVKIHRMSDIILRCSRTFISLLLFFNQSTLNICILRLAVKKRFTVASCVCV